jgi:hypothetical protein
MGYFADLAQRPIDQDGFADDLLLGQVAPATRIPGIISVVTQNEYLAWSYRPLITGVGWNLFDIWLLQRKPIDEDRFSFENDHVSR